VRICLAVERTWME